ncbi:DUF5518 domain-containing protein [Haloterrigena salifodinae]|uniref:DUF5518 domain-containing protein n=1 Tax=Haloterrigena salifodinae TaxID=2675099 RepID=UPI000F86AB34|nr:DUF5518 domain-containing protein [Haloterrigena salifodinae]
MHPIRALHALRDGVSDNSLRVAILVGLATVPFTVALSWDPIADDIVAGGSVSGAPLLLAGLFVGYYYSDRETESRRAGIWTGLVASIAAVLVFGANTVATIVSEPSQWAVVAVIGTPFVLALGVGLIVLFSMFTAQFADWVTTRLRRAHRAPDASDDGGLTVPNPRWRTILAAYVLATPPVLGSVFLEIPASGAGFVLSVLGLLVLVPLSVVALGALFADATAPRSSKTDWAPNALAYVGAPIGTYALVYAVAALRGSGHPDGYAIYAFIGVLWITAVVYLFNRHRYFDAGGSAVRQLG